MNAIDVLIVGGGPAGLLAAAQLSQEHRVTLIERGLLGETTKFWGTTERRLRRHGLQDLVLHRPARMTASTFLGARLAVGGDFAVVDDPRLLAELLVRCKSRGVELKENCELVNLHWSRDGIHVHTTGETFFTRLVVDATGGGSPIASTFRLHRIDGFYAVYGALLEGIKLHTADIVLGHVGFLGNPMPVFELIPTGRDSAYCVVFTFSKSLVPPATLAVLFEKYCQHNPFFELTSASKRGVEKSGAIPIGQMRRRRLRGVVSFGEAALIQPPLMGTAFNAVLDYSESVCVQISRSLKDTSGIPRVPPNLYPTLKLAQDRIQLMVARKLMSGNVEVFDAAIGTLGALPESVLFNFFSNELTVRELLQVTARIPFGFFLRSVRG